MELHQLRYFLAVVDRGSFTAASTAVRVSQSGISTQIQKLDRELGLALLDRSSRHVALTPAGTQLVPYARSAVAAVDDVTGVANDIRGLVTGTLRVGTVTGLIWQPLFDALATVHREHPGIDIRLHEGISDDLSAQVQEGTADIAIACWSRDCPPDVEWTVVFDDPLLAAVGPTHPWSSRDRVGGRELARADLITFPRGTGSRTGLDAILTRADTSAIPRWEVATPTLIEALTTRGLGVGIASATTMKHWVNVTRLCIDDGAAHLQLGILRRDRPSYAAQALIRILTTQLAAAEVEPIPRS